MQTSFVPFPGNAGPSPPPPNDAPSYDAASDDALHGESVWCCVKCTPGLFFVRVEEGGVGELEVHGNKRFSTHIVP